MSPDISEFSYGFALTDELSHNPLLPLKAAPLFPSLIAEGKAGGGYDVQLAFPGFALFLQFKLSDCMVRGTAKEVKKAGFVPPFYRMHLRPGKHSNQHQMLLDLEAQGEKVYYAAPHFHLPDELNDSYLNRRMVESSMFLRPKRIGSLDDGYHHVAFHTNHGAYLFSEPTKLLDRGELNAAFRGDLTETAIHTPMFEANELAERLVQVVERHISEDQLRPEQRTQLRQSDPLRQIGFVARAFLGCEVLVVRKSG